MERIQPDNGGPVLVKTPTVDTFCITYLESGPGWVEAEFRPDDRYRNNFGLVQGGVLGVYLDNIMGQSCYTLLGKDKSISTMTMNLQFLEPAPMGLIKGTARVTKKGSRVFFAEGDAQDASGKVLARATGTFLILERKRAQVPTESS
jgi:uncharacterized protein (TIGR00369 family)